MVTSKLKIALLIGIRSPFLDPVLGKSGYSIWEPGLSTRPDLIVHQNGPEDLLLGQELQLSSGSPSLHLTQLPRYGYQLRQAINRCLREHPETCRLDPAGNLLLLHHLLYFLNDQHYHRLDLREVCYIEARLHYSHFYLPDGSAIIFRLPINRLTELLAPYDFIRSHRSYLINLLQVDRFDFPNYRVRLGEFSVPMSRHYRREIRQMLQI